MNINDRSKTIDDNTDRLSSLTEHADGFVIVGYTKGTHDKFARFYTSNNACREALICFNPRVQSWMSIGSDGEDDETAEKG